VDGAYPSPDAGLPVTGFGAPGAREDRRAARGREVCSRCLAVSWIQQLKSLASARDARSHATSTASRNRHHRSRSTEYDRSVDSDFPDGSQQVPQENRHRLDDLAAGPDYLIGLMGIAGGHETARPGHHEPGQIAFLFLIRFDHADKLAPVTETSP
jgi:hypothetical protein